MCSLNFVIKYTLDLVNKKKAEAFFVSVLFLLEE